MEASTKKTQSQPESKKVILFGGKMFRTLSPGDIISVALKKLLQGGRRGSQAIDKFAKKGAGCLDIKDQVSS